MKIPNLEWSAVIFYKRTKDAINVVDILLMSIDTTANTEFEYDDPAIVDHIVGNNLYDCRLGSLHSHHSMTSFFSSVDDTDLGVQALQRDEYLSIVINNKFDIVGKIAVKGIRNTTLSYLDLNGQKKSFKEEDEIVCYYKVEYATSIEVDTFYETRLQAVKQLVAARKPPITASKAVGFTSNKPTSKPNDIVDTYNMFITGYYDYNDIKLAPEEYLEMYITLYGEVNSETAIIQKVVDHVEKLPKNKFNLTLLKDYKKWIKQTIQSDTKTHYGQPNYSNSWSWD